jgi:NADH-quinone oxidoreductase subunit H
MKFGWKTLIPVSLLWIVVVAFARAMRNEYQWDLRQTVLVIAVPIIVLLVILFIVETVRERKELAAAQAAEEAAGEFDPMAGGFPVPPMPGQSYTPTRRTKATVGASALTSGTTSDTGEEA